MKAAIVLMKTATKEQELHKLLRSAEIPDEIREEWAEKTIKRAIERGRKKAAPLAWLEWADKWESGEDRTEEAAKAAYKAAHSAHGMGIPSSQTFAGATQAASALVDTEFYMQKDGFKYQSISSLCAVCSHWSVAWVNNSNVSRRVLNAEITKQLDDLISLIEVYEPEEKC